MISPYWDHAVARTSATLKKHTGMVAAFDNQHVEQKLVLSWRGKAASFALTTTHEEKLLAELESHYGERYIMQAALLRSAEERASMHCDRSWQSFTTISTLRSPSTGIGIVS